MCMCVCSWSSSGWSSSGWQWLAVIGSGWQSIHALTREAWFSLEFHVLMQSPCSTAVESHTKCTVCVVFIQYCMDTTPMKPIVKVSVRSPVSAYQQVVVCTQEGWCE